MRKVTDKNSLFVKIMSGALAVLMLGGIIATALIMLLSK
jgi:hypothetical protein